MRKVLFTVSLFAIGGLDTWLAYASLQTGISSGDWVQFLPSLMFFAVAVAAVISAISLLRPKRRKRKQ